MGKICRKPQKIVPGNTLAYKSDLKTRQEVVVLGIGVLVSIFAYKMMIYFWGSALIFTLNKSVPNDLSDLIPDSYGNTSQSNQVSRLMTLFRSTITINRSRLSRSNRLSGKF